MDLLYEANRLLLLPGGALWAWLGTRTASLIFGLLVAVAVAWRPERRVLLLPALLAVALSDLSVNRVLKPYFADDRPCVVRPELRTAPPGDPGRCVDSYAFPSGHAANTAALAATLGSPPLAAVSALVGAQRVITAQHDLGDVTAGWAWGAMIGALARLAAARRQRGRPEPARRGDIHVQ